MTRRKVLTCCILLLLAGAVVHKSLEVAGLRELVRRLTIPGQTVSSVATKHRGEEPSAGFGASTGEPLTDDSDIEPLSGPVTASGGLSKEVIERLDLTRDEIGSLTEVIRRFRTEAMQDLAKRLKSTASHSNDDGSDHRFYYARARADRGQTFADALSLEFGAILGRDRSRPLAEGFLRDELLGRTAKMDLELERIRLPEGEVNVNYQLRSPKTGEVPMFGGSPLAEFEAKFGKLFDPPEAE